MQEQFIQPEDEVAAATPNEDMKDKQQAVVADKSMKKKRNRFQKPHILSLLNYLLRKRKAS